MSFEEACEVADGFTERFILSFFLEYPGSSMTACWRSHCRIFPNTTCSYENIRKKTHSLADVCVLGVERYNYRYRTMMFAPEVSIFGSRVCRHMGILPLSNTHHEEYMRMENDENRNRSIRRVSDLIKFRVKLFSGLFDSLNHMIDDVVLHNRNPDMDKFCRYQYRKAKYDEESIFNNPEFVEAFVGKACPKLLEDK